MIYNYEYRTPLSALPVLCRVIYLVLQVYGEDCGRGYDAVLIICGPSFVAQRLANEVVPIVLMTTKTKTTKKAIPTSRGTSKKTTTKKAVTQKKPPVAKKIVTAKGPTCFWVHEGPILKDLLELEAALKSMSELMYKHHVTKDRNDFADWVDAVLKDAETAALLRKAKKPETAHKAVVRQLKLYIVPA